MEDCRTYFEDRQDIALTIGISTRRFWLMTPGDFDERWVMFTRREEREWERAAWMVHHIMSAFVGSKNTPSVGKLLGRVTDA